MSCLLTRHSLAQCFGLTTWHLPQKGLCHQTIDWYLSPNQRHASISGHHLQIFASSRAGTRFILIEAGDWTSTTSLMNFPLILLTEPPPLYIQRLTAFMLSYPLHITYYRAVLWDSCYDNTFLKSIIRNLKWLVRQGFADWVSLIISGLSHAPTPYILFELRVFSCTHRIQRGTERRQKSRKMTQWSRNNKMQRKNVTVEWDFQF